MEDFVVDRYDIKDNWQINGTIQDFHLYLNL